jgi:hypothetical protein
MDLPDPMPTNNADSIRNSLQAFVAHETGSVSSLTEIHETILIRHGSYCGRRFGLMGFSLVWFHEEGQVKLYAPNGTLELSCSLSHFCGLAAGPANALRRAA